MSYDISYDIEALRKLLAEIQGLDVRVANMRTVDSSASYRERYGTANATSVMLGELEGLVGLVAITARCIAVPALARLDEAVNNPALEPVTAELLKDGRTGMPLWNCAIAETVALTCPHCHSTTECEVEVSKHADSITALLDSERCEDCGAYLCSECPRTEGAGEEEGLIWCRDCRPLPATSAEPPYTPVPPATGQYETPALLEVAPLPGETPIETFHRAASLAETQAATDKARDANAPNELGLASKDDIERVRRLK